MNGSLPDVRDIDRHFVKNGMQGLCTVAAKGRYSTSLKGVREGSKYLVRSLPNTYVIYIRYIFLRKE